MVKLDKEAKLGHVMTVGFTLRPAMRADLGAIRDLMDASMDALLPTFYAADEAAAAREFMGLDTQLVDDGTYVLVVDGGRLIGSGGWGKRATLFGGDASPGRDAAMLDPAKDAARVRAMYTHPDAVRRGVGRAVIDWCEAAARADGFSRAELVATLPGEPFYRAVGYEEIERIAATSACGVAVPLVRMGKRLS